MVLTSRQPKRFFITATGTDIGKSFITAALARQARALGRTVAAYKPVMSGYDPAKPEDSDAALLLRAMDKPVTPENIAHISPWRFAAALAPSMAAKLEQREINFDEVVAHSQTAIAGNEEFLLIEGVGGIMVPLTPQHTMLDWMQKTGMPALLVTGSYLGTISHTLTALAALEQRRVPLHTIIVNESENSSVDLSSTVEELSHWAKKTSIITVTRRAANDGWKDISELRVLLD